MSSSVNLYKGYGEKAAEFSSRIYSEKLQKLINKL